MTDEQRFDVRTGYLGWSNYRSGTEFYRGGIGNARWEQREGPYATTGSPAGLLLQDDIERDGAAHEGCEVVVISIKPRGVAEAVAAKVRAMIDAEFGAITEKGER